MARQATSATNLASAGGAIIDSAKPNRPELIDILDINGNEREVAEGLLSSSTLC